MAAQYLILQASSQSPSSRVRTLISFHAKSGPSRSEVREKTGEKGVTGPSQNDIDKHFRESKRNTVLYRYISWMLFLFVLPLGTVVAGYVDR